MSVNKVILIGNVGKDPEIRAMTSGKEVALFSLATSNSWKDKQTGERKDKTEWHRIVVYGQGLVNVIKQYVKKGNKLYLEGSLQTRKWTDSAGIEKYTTEVVLQGFNSTLKMLTNKQNNNNYNANYYESINKNIVNKEEQISKKDNEFVEETIDDDIPF